MKVYGHLRDQHSTNMAQKVTFLEEPKTDVAMQPSQKDKPTAEPQKKTTAQAKATYSYPWWASNNAVEVFLGQANEPVQIVPQAKYIEAAKQAMGREVFEQELTEPQALLEEFQERVGIATVEKLKSKIFYQPEKTSRLIFKSQVRPIESEEVFADSNSKVPRMMG
jgi:hypothetical protein